MLGLSQVHLQFVGFAVLLQMACMDENNDTEMPESKTKANTNPKEPQNGSTSAKGVANVAQNGIS